MEDSWRVAGLRKKVILSRGLAVTGDARRENNIVAGRSHTQRERVARRIDQLYTDDEQFRNAQPDPSVRHAARQPNLRFPQILEVLAEGYADRPALGWRARALTIDPATGRTGAQLLNRFDTITYRDLWGNVRAIASAWHHDAKNPVKPGDFVATVGFASAEYLTVDLVCG